MCKVILDTDIGSDIDDSLAISYLLKKKECELLGITTVSSDVNLRAKMISAFCKYAEREIPIYPGVSEFLTKKSEHPIFITNEKINHWKHEENFPQGEAIEFMRKTIRKYPGEVTLLGIGPLTNIAILFMIDPEVAGMLKEIVLMCGVFGKKELECNAYCDPYATNKVFSSNAKIKVIGLDVTMQTVKDKHEVEQIAKDTILDIAIDYGEDWFKRTEEIVFHDPLAAACVFSNVCEFEKGTVSYETEGENRFFTTFKKGEGTHEIAIKVDKEKFFKEFFSVVKEN